MTSLFRLGGLLSGLLVLLVSGSPETIPGGGPAPAAPGRVFVAQGHRGKITALVPAGQGQVISAGEDGYIGIWDTGRMAAADRFQASPWPVAAMSLRPGHPEIALLESDGLGMYRISAWNYREKRNLFKLRSRDPVSFITYSAGGNFIIASRSGRTGTVFIHPSSGAVLDSPEDLTGIVSFAATGRSERSMIAYSPSGSLSYWDLTKNEELRRFPAPPNMRSPLLFDNNRFFGGFDDRGLVVFDAVTMAEVAREEGLSQGLLIPAPGGEAGFFCVPGSSGGGREGWRHFVVSAGGGIEARSRHSFPGDGPEADCAVWIPRGASRSGRGGQTRRNSPPPRGGDLFLGAADGRVHRTNGSEPPSALATAPSIPVRNGAVSGRTLALITGNGLAAAAHRDYAAFREGEPLVLHPAGPYRLVAPAGEGFIFWQNETAADPPLLAPGPGERGTFLGRSPDNFPLKAVSASGGQALFLDSAGNVTVVNTGTGRIAFTWAAPGSLDAAFLDGRNIIIGRSSSAGGTPFLKVNIATGETVPLAYPAQVGLGLHPGSGGTFYAAAIETGGAVKTTIIALDPVRPALSRKLVEYQDEDSAFAFAESSRIFATTIGGDGASLYDGGVSHPFERGPGLPLALLDGGDAFIVLDSDGNASWHGLRDGSLLALLRIYPERWELELRGGRVVSGPVEYRAAPE